MPQGTHSPASPAGDAPVPLAGENGHPENGRRDADLVRQLLAGDDGAFARLVDQWSPVMLRIARSFVGSSQSAEDAVQDAWLGMLSGLARFEGRSSLRTWTFSILVNRARTRGAGEARMLPLSPLGTEDGAAGGDWLTSHPAARREGWSSLGARTQHDCAPETVVLSREVLRQLDRALSALPSRQRTVVTMRDIYGMPPEAVCAALDISPANQRVLLHRARAVLRAALVSYRQGT